MWALLAPPEDSLDWTVHLTLVPKSRHLRSPVLGSIYDLACESDAGLQNNAEYPLVLAYGCMAARAAMEAFVFDATWARLRGAACGFDSGDFLYLEYMEGSKYQVKISAG